MSASAYRVFTGYISRVTTTGIAPGGVVARYRKASSASTPGTPVTQAPVLTLDLMPLMRGVIAQGSLCFSVGALTYYDRAGKLYHSFSHQTGTGTEAGTINYTTGIATITSWAAGSSAFTLISGIVNPGSPGQSAVFGRTDSRPLKPQSFYISATALDGTAITGSSNSAGVVSGTYCKGIVNLDSGVFNVAFGHEVGGEWQDMLVDPTTIKYNTVSYTYLPLDKDIIQIDPVRLPTDGRVPIYRKGNYAVLGHTGEVGPVTVSNGQTISCGRVRLSRVRVIDANGVNINSGYTADLEAGTVTFTSVTGYAQPVRIRHRIEDMRVISDVQITGAVKLNAQLSHDFPVGSVLSSAVMFGDVQAECPVFFDQASWDGTSWADAVSGSVASASYNKVLSPIELTNAGTITERWAIQFTSTTAFKLIGENVGQIATGSINTDLSPVNALTGEAYFTLRALGWGSGWAVGNVVRFNTTGGPSFWAARTIQAGSEPVNDDAFTLLVRGDVNAD